MAIKNLGGKAKKASFTSTRRRVPDPVLAEVDAIIDQFHKDNGTNLSVTVQTNLKLDSTLVELIGDIPDPTIEIVQTQDIPDPTISQVEEKVISKTDSNGKRTYRLQGKIRTIQYLADKYDIRKRWISWRTRMGVNINDALIKTDEYLKWYEEEIAEENRLKIILES